MSASTASTQVKFRYTANVVNYATVLSAIRTHSGMSFSETFQLTTLAQSNKRQFFTVTAQDPAAAKSLAGILEQNDCRVKYN